MAYTVDEPLQTVSYRSGRVRLGLAATPAGLREVRWLRPSEKWPVRPGNRETDRVLRGVTRALDGYFAGSELRYSFQLDLRGVSPFRRRVMETLVRSVPPGEVVTYGELALMAGRLGAARAVGTTMSRNPLPIFVPCHRVVAASGPGGFGPGLQRKRDLLALEGYNLAI